MKRYDIETKPYHEGASMQVDDYGDWCDAAEALHEIVKRDAEITKLRGLLRALVDEIESDSASVFYVGRSDCPQCEGYSDEVGIVCPYHAAKAALNP